jgi:hypothetical protein
MRMTSTLALGLGLALLVTPSAAAQEQQDADRKVSGGVTAKGWTGKEDAGNKQGLTVNDSKFADEGKGFRLSTGPAGLYWNPANVAKGDYTVSATFSEAEQTYNHPHPFGVFIGGSDLGSATPSAMYCAAYRNGNYIIRMFSGGKRVDIVGRPLAHEAVKKAETPKSPVVQEVGWTVKGDAVSCVINGTAVWTGTKADVTGAGKLASTDGIAGIRVSHNSDAMVTGFAIKK